MRFKHLKSFDSYRIFIQDVDGIIIGSPVRYMGIQVGYVSNLKIITDEVYVQFIITDKSIRLPKGVVATVEFTGLGGSKALELYPPTGAYSENLIVVKRPTRISDSLGLLYDMFDTLGKIFYKVTSFGTNIEFVTEVKQINKDTKNTSTPQETLKNSNDWIDKTQEKINEYHNKTKGVKNE